MVYIDRLTVILSDEDPADLALTQGLGPRQVARLRCTHRAAVGLRTPRALLAADGRGRGAGAPSSRFHTPDPKLVKNWFMV
jgi:hypothetical protein